MGTPQLTSCCCGCSLRTGALIIGWIHMIPLILSLLAIVICGPFLVEQIPSVTLKATGLVGVASLVIVVYTMIGLLPSLLLIGAYQRSAPMLLLWLVVSTIHGLIEFCLPTLLIVTNQGNIEANPFYIITCILILIQFYFILVVYSLYKEIQGGPRYVAHSYNSYKL